MHQLKINKESRSFFDEQFINPLRRLGFRLVDIGYLAGKEGHVCNIIMTYTPLSIISDYDFARVKAICEQDDDNQPHSMFRYYLGTLFITIPILP